MRRGVRADQPLEHRSLLVGHGQRGSRSADSSSYRNPYLIARHATRWLSLGHAVSLQAAFGACTRVAPGQVTGKSTDPGRFLRGARTESVRSLMCDRESRSTLRAVVTCRTARGRTAKETISMKFVRQLDSDQRTDARKARVSV